MEGTYESCDDSDGEAPELIAVALPESNNLPNSQKDTHSQDQSPPCPVTILSGFLGSGKTTLIQYILQSSNHGKRIAVIENEFGEGLAIESLIARDGIDPSSNSLQDLIELPNGCVCCTVKDSLVETLELLIAKRSDLDYILIEASGMADPGPIASVFWLDDALESRLKLDGIVTLVDGKHILDQLKSTEEAARQIAYADRILLNKVDLISSQTTHEVEQALRRIQPRAPIRKTSYSKVPDLDWILDANCFGGLNHLEEVDGGEQQGHGHDHEHHDCSECHSKEVGNVEGHDHCHDHEDHDCSECSADGHNLGHHHAHEHGHTHTASISTIALEHPGSVDVDRLNAWLADILWPNQDETDKVLTAMLHETNTTEDFRKSGDPVNQNQHASKDDDTTQQIFRIKGILSILSSEDYVWEEQTITGSTNRDNTCTLDPRRFIVQGVHDLWDIQPVTSIDLRWGPKEDRLGKIVVIGKSLREQELRDGFHACFAPTVEET